MTWRPDDATSTVFATLTFVSIVGSALVIVFEYLRSRYSDIYVPRSRSQGHKMLPAPSTRPLMWIKHVLDVSDEDFFKSVGLDGLVLLRFIRLCIKVSAIAGVLGLLILVPVYFSCPGIDGVVGINLFTMANVEQNGKALWAPMIMTYIFTVILLYLLHVEYGVISHLRQTFLELGDADAMRPQARYSVQVENVPVEYRSTEKLTQFFECLFPGQIEHACISVGMHPLAVAIEKRTKAVAEMERAVAQREASPNKERPVVRLFKGIPVHSTFTCRDVKEFDAITYYESEITKLNSSVMRYQLEARNAENADVLPPGTIILDEDINGNDDDEVNTTLSMDNVPDGGKRITKKSVAGTGFVTFKSRRAQVSACQVALISQKYPNLKVLAAPDPHDIIWGNVTTSKAYTDETSNVVSAIYWVGIFFWGVVLGVIATLSNLEALSEYLPFIDDINPTLYAIIAGILPVYALVLVLYLIPKIMAWIGEYIEKRKTKSSISFEVFNWNFFYQLTNVYFLMVAGSVATAIADLIDDPSSMLSTLGSSLPSISVLFINYTLNVMMIQNTADMLRTYDILLFLFYRLFFDDKKLTRRQVIEGPLEDEPLDYGVVLPKQLYLMVLVITYWAIAPILILIIAIAFTSSYLRFKYKMLYVHVPIFEAGGLFWYGLYKYTMYALVASIVTMIAYLGIKEGPSQAALTFPLLYIVFKTWNYTESQYKDMSLFVAYSNAVEADCSIYAEPAASEALLKSFHSDFYKQPYFSEAQVAQIQPYRIDGIPLFTPSGKFSREYYNKVDIQDARTNNIISSDILNDTSAPYISNGSNSNATVGYRPPEPVPVKSPMFVTRSDDSSADDKL